jgi:hypothetical protein
VTSAEIVNINGFICLIFGRPVSCAPWLVRAGSHLARSAGTETTYRAIWLTRKLRRPTGKMRRGETFSGFSEHPYTGGNGPGFRTAAEPCGSASRLLGWDLPVRGGTCHQAAMSEAGFEVWFSGEHRPGPDPHMNAGCWLRVRHRRAADPFSSFPTLIMRARTETPLGPRAAVDLCLSKR